MLKFVYKNPISHLDEVWSINFRHICGPVMLPLSKPERRGTLAVVTSPGVWFSALAVCNPTDTFSKEVGRQTALARLYFKLASLGVDPNFMKLIQATYDARIPQEIRERRALELAERLNRLERIFVDDNPVVDPDPPATPALIPQMAKEEAA